MPCCASDRRSGRSRRRPAGRTVTSETRLWVTCAPDTVPALSRSRHACCRVEQDWRANPATSVSTPPIITSTEPVRAALPFRTRSSAVPADSAVERHGDEPEDHDACRLRLHRGESADGLAACAVAGVGQAGDDDCRRGGDGGSDADLGEGAGGRGRRRGDRAGVRGGDRCSWRFLRTAGRRGRRD